MLRIHSLPACFVRRAHAWELFQETGRQLGAEAAARKMADGQTRQP
ncbi:hypothetical protein [Eikenella corrodens]|nr:hypothetical protein [Eikenella corrodens]